MNPPSEDIVEILEQSSVGIGTFATDLFLHQMPDTPDACISVHDTGGFDPEPHDYNKPTVQVRVRGDKMGYLDAWNQAEDIKDALHELTNETFGGTRYIQIMMQGDILDIGDDEKGRPVLTLNFLVHRS